MGLLVKCIEQVKPDKALKSQQNSFSEEKKSFLMRSNEKTFNYTIFIIFRKHKYFFYVYGNHITFYNVSKLF